MQSAIVSAITSLLGQISLRYTGRPSLPMPRGSVVEIDVHLSGERIRDDERRRREIVRANLRMNSSFEVPVAGKHGRHDQVAVGDGLGNVGRQRPRFPMHVVHP